MSLKAKRSHSNIRLLDGEMKENVVQTNQAK